MALADSPAQLEATRTAWFPYEPHSPIVVSRPSSYELCSSTKIGSRIGLHSNALLMDLHFAFLGSTVEIKSVIRWLSHAFDLRLRQARFKHGNLRDRFTHSWEGLLSRVVDCFCSSFGVSMVKRVIMKESNSHALQL